MFQNSRHVVSATLNFKSYYNYLNLTPKYKIINTSYYSKLTAMETILFLSLFFHFTSFQGGQIPLLSPPFPRLLSAALVYLELRNNEPRHTHFQSSFSASFFQEVSEGFLLAAWVLVALRRIPHISIQSKMQNT